MPQGDEGSSLPHDPWAPPDRNPVSVQPTWPGYGQQAPPVYGQPNWLGYPPPPPPPRRRTGRIVAIVAGVCVLVLLVVAVGIGLGNRIGSGRSAQPTKSLAAARARIDAELPRLVAFVAQDRGLAWTTRPKAEVLADPDFVDALNAPRSRHDPYDYKADPDDLGTTLRALGLVPGVHVYEDAQGSATSDNVVGFYDDETRRLVVRGAAWTPSMEYTLVHELTHAIQDQNFDLGTLEAKQRYDDESALALRSLIEGDAERIADDYYDQQSTSWQDSVDSDQSGAAASDLPIVDTIDGMPYAVGSDFVNGLAAAQGNAGVDRAFRQPPTTSQQLLHPVQWATGRLPAPRRPAFPPADQANLADRGVFGVLGLWLTVDGTDQDLDQAAALDAWDGDAYVSTDDGSKTCFTDIVHFTDAPGRAKATDYLQPWIDDQHVQAQPVGVSDLQLSACR